MTSQWYLSDEPIATIFDIHSFIEEHFHKKMASGLCSCKLSSKHRDNDYG
jgi:hypothetical protein